MAFGLDIGSHSIKAVELEPKGGLPAGRQGFALLAAGIARSPQNGIASEVESDLVKVAETIKKLVSDSKISSSEVNLALPESQVFTRVINLPYLTDEEVAAAVSWQAEPYIPIPVAEASIDHQIIARYEPSGGDPGRIEVLLVAAPKSLIQKYTKVVGLAGLTALSVETELLALSRATAPNNQTVLVTDLGATSTDIAIVRSGQLVVSRSVATAGDVLTRAVAKGLATNPTQSEEYKKSYGLAQSALEGKVKTALSPVFDIIIDEMKKTVQYYKTELRAQDTPVSAILTGGTAGMVEITVILAEKLGMEVIVGNPFSKVAVDERTLKSVGPWAPLYAIAVGLAEK